MVLYWVLKYFQVEEGLWPKKLEISHASQILVLSELSTNYYCMKKIVGAVWELSVQSSPIQVEIHLLILCLNLNLNTSYNTCNLGYIGFKTIKGKEKSANITKGCEIHIIMLLKISFNVCFICHCGHQGHELSCCGGLFEGFDNFIIILLLTANIFESGPMSTP